MKITFLPILSLVSILSLAQEANFSFKDFERLSLSRDCTDRVVDHGGTIDSSCQAQGHLMGCYDVIETVCTEGRREVSRTRREVSNGRCGDSYSDCW